MILTNKNTEFVLIYTSKNDSENGFLTNIGLGIIQINKLGFGNNIHLLVDSSNISKIENQLIKYNVEKPDLEIYTGNYAKLINKIEKENVIVIITGHGVEVEENPIVTGLLSCEKYEEATTLHFYKPIIENKNIKNALFFWCQCKAGYYQNFCKLRSINTNFYIFGASNRGISISSTETVCRVFISEHKKQNALVKYILNQNPKDETISINNSIFFLIILTDIETILNKEIKTDEIIKLYKNITSKYCFKLSNKDGKSIYEFYSNSNKNEKDLTTYERNLCQIIETLKNEKNFPWLKINESGNQNIIEDLTEQDVNIKELIENIYNCKIHELYKDCLEKYVN